MGDETPSVAPPSQSVTSEEESMLEVGDTQNMEKMASIVTSMSEMAKAVDKIRQDVDTLKRKNPEQSDDRISKPESRKRSRREMDSSSDAESGDDELDLYMNAGQSSQDQNSDDEFWQDLMDCIPDNDETGAETSAKIAAISNKALQNKPDENKIKSVYERTRRPKNIEYLKVPQVDEFLWHQLKSSTRQHDFVLQKAHSTMASAAVPLIRALDHVQNSSDKTLKTHLVDAFKILTHGMTTNVETRRERIKREMAYKYKHLAKLEKSADKLFGDKLQDSIKTVETTKIIVQQPEMRKKPFLGKTNKWPQKNVTNQSRPNLMRHGPPTSQNRYQAKRQAWKQKK